MEAKAARVRRGGSLFRIVAKAHEYSQCGSDGMPAGASAVAYWERTSSGDIRSPNGRGEADGGGGGVFFGVDERATALNIRQNWLPK